MRKGATKDQVDHVVDRLRERGYGAKLSGSEVSVIGAIGVLDDDKARLAEQLASLPAVERVVPVLKRFKLASREFQPDPTVVKVDDLRIGDGSLVVMAGPCSVESEEQLLALARAGPGHHDHRSVPDPKAVDLHHRRVGLEFARGELEAFEDRDHAVDRGER